MGGEESLEKVWDGLGSGAEKWVSGKGRMGGDEFGVIVEDADMEIAGQVAERIQQAVSEMSHHDILNSDPVTLSLGVASWKKGRSKRHLLILTDEALRRAKQAGRNKAVAFV